MPRVCYPSLSLCLITAVAAYTQPLLGQDATPSWQPVDQAVSDLDLRAASTRRVEQGIGVFGQSGSLYQRPNDGQGWFLNGQEVTQQYQLRQPGFTAWIDRPDYLVQDPFGEMSLNNAPAIDGQFIDLVPPNTVFDLSNAAQQVFIPYTEDPNSPSPRVNTRIDGWANTGSSQSQVGAPPPVAHRLPAHLIARRAEYRAAEAQRQAEQTALDDPHADDVSSPDQAGNADEAGTTQDQPVEPPQD